MDLVTILLLILVSVAALLFIGGIFAAGIYSLRNRPGDMPTFLGQAITVIGGVLATNLGAVLGISVAEGVSKTLGSAQGFETNISGYLQIGAAFLYIFGLLLAFIFWVANKFSTEPEKVVSTLPELSKTLLGVIVGALAVALGVAKA